MRENGIYKNIIHERLKAILALIKEGKNTLSIEREAAFLVLDTMEAIEKKEVTLVEAHEPFVKIEYALDQKLSSALSEDARELLSEAILLDEVGAPHGPNMNLLVTLATKIVGRTRHFSQSGIKSFAARHTAAQTL